MTHLELLRGLKRISPSFSLNPNQANVWTPTTDRKGVGLYYNLAGYATDRGEFLCGLTEGEMPPYDIVTPAGRTIRPGWRTAIWKIVRAGFATKSAVDSIFGCDLPVTRTVDSLLVWECGCRFQSTGKCPHGTRRSEAEGLEEELARLPGVEDDRFFASTDATS